MPKGILPPYNEATAAVHDILSWSVTENVIPNRLIPADQHFRDCKNIGRVFKYLKSVPGIFPILSRAIIYGLSSGTYMQPFLRTTTCVAIMISQSPQKLIWSELAVWGWSTNVRPSGLWLENRYIDWVSYVVSYDVQSCTLKLYYQLWSFLPVFIMSTMLFP